MAKHSYTAREALDKILERVRAKAPELSAEIQRNIDLGKEVEENSSPRQRSNEPDYERKISLPLEEALRVTLDTLQAHFVEQPLFITSADENFAKAAEGVPVLLTGFAPGPPATVMHGREMLTVTGSGEPKALAVEVQPETRLVGTGEIILSLKPMAADRINARIKSLDALRALIEFTD